MNIQITARHFKARPDLQQYIEDAVNGLSQVYDGIVSAEVVLENETQNNSDNKMVEVSLLVYKDKLFVKEKSDDFVKSVGACVDKLERQLIKYKDRKHEGQQPHERPEVPATDEII